jgi:hypothetical protein
MRFLRSGRVAFGGAAILAAGFAAFTATADEPAVKVKAAIPADAQSQAGGHTMFGGTPARNMVDLSSKQITDKPDPSNTEGIKWQAELGSRAYGGPTVAGGKVFATRRGTSRSTRASSCASRRAPASSSGKPSTTSSNPAR